MTETLRGLLSNRRIINWVIPLVLFSLFWGGFLTYTGTLNSGYHFVDDHEMVRIAEDLGKKNVLEVSSEWVLRDLGLRFRPVYYIHRIVSVEVLGTNFLFLSIQNLVLAVITSWLLYLFCRNLKFSSLSSYVFVFAGLVGTQAAIWWRLGPNETIGLFLFAVGLYSLSKSYIIQRKRRFYKYLGLVFFILASLCKESFIMLIPFVLFLNFYLFHIHSELNRSLTLWQNIRVNKWFNLILSIVFVIEGYFVVAVVGTNKIGYAGGDASSLNPTRILSTFRSLGLESNWQLVLLSIAGYLLGMGVYYYYNRKLPVTRIKLLVAALAGFILIVVPQLVLYAKSGIYERYLIPGTLGFSFLIAFLFSQTALLLNSKARKLFIAIALLLGIVLLYPKLKTAMVFAQQFATEGRTVNAALSSVKANSNPEDTIIVVADPVQNFEEGYSLKNYLLIEQGKSNLYFEVITPNSEGTEFEKGLGDGFISFLNAKESSELSDKSSAKLLFVFGNVEEAFVNSSDWFVPANYTRNGYLRYVVYVKN